MKLLILVILFASSNVYAKSTFHISGDPALELKQVLDGVVDTSIPENKDGALVSCRAQTFSDFPDINHCSVIGNIRSASAGAHPYKMIPRSNELEVRPYIEFTGNTANLLVNSLDMHIVGKSNLIRCNKLQGSKYGHTCKFFLIENVGALLAKPSKDDKDI